MDFKKFKLMDLGTTGAIKGLATGYGSECANWFATTTCLEHESFEGRASDFAYEFKKKLVFYK